MAVTSLRSTIGVGSSRATSQKLRQWRKLKECLGARGPISGSGVCNFVAEPLQRAYKALGHRTHRNASNIQRRYILLRATNNRAVFCSELVARRHRLDDCNGGRNDRAQHEEGRDDDFNESAALIF
jgi:hypothetical protein